MSASGAPFVQKKRGNLRHALLDSAYRAAAARIAQIDLVGAAPILLALTAGLAQRGFSGAHSCSASDASQHKLAVALEQPKLSETVIQNNIQGHACKHVIALQDVGSLVELARRRCTDDKAGVRKAGVQLLEALLLLRASGAGGAEAVLPSVADLEAVQHAAADPLVGP